MKGILGVRAGVGASVLAALLCGGSTLAYAEEFVLGDGVKATTNVTASIGASFRTDDPNPAIIAPGNGAPQGIAGSASSLTADDGTLNFDRGDVVSAPITVIADIDLNIDDSYGVFVRGKGVTDLALELNDVNHGHAPNGYDAHGRLDDGDFNNLAKFSNIALLDAFAYADVDVADHPVTFRLGRQVVSWGESIFIQGGINTANPIDVSAFRRPGSQVKEGLLPVGMAYVNAGVTDNLSVEGFVQFEYQETVLDGCGTFFSTNDVIAEGCDRLTLINAGNDPTAIAGDVAIHRRSDIKPDDFSLDQGGVALRYYSPSLDTEFGAFYTRTHSKIPALGFYAGNIAGNLAASGGTATFIPNDPIGGNTKYAAEYAEDIDMFGFSAATNIFGLAVGGEVSYRPNQPVQINTNDLTVAALTGGNSALAGVANNPADALFNGVAAGSFVSGYSEAEQIKGQISAIHYIDRALGADRITLIGEIGFEALDIDDGGLGLNYGRSSAYGNPNSSGNDASGLITDFSYGYRLRAAFDFSNVLYGINMTPSVTFSHDVDGTSSDGQFEDNRKGIGLGVSFDYLNRYNLAVDYTNFFDGEYSVSTDRDFISTTARVQF